MQPDMTLDEILDALGQFDLREGIDFIVSPGTTDVVMSRHAMTTLLKELQGNGG